MESICLYFSSIIRKKQTMGMLLSDDSLTLTCFLFQLRNKLRIQIRTSQM